MQGIDQFSSCRKGRCVPSEWDRFRLHHVFTDHNFVVHFETGEICVTTRFNGRVGANGYRLYKDRNVIIASTSDHSFTSLLRTHNIALLDPETDKPVPAAWMQKTADHKSAQQVLVIDLDHMVAVGMHPTSRMPETKDPRRDWLYRKPRHIQQAPGVYYPSPNVAPEGHSIRLTRPHTMTDDEKAHEEGMVRAAKAWWAMSGWEETFNRGNSYDTWEKLSKADDRTSPQIRSDSGSSVRWSWLKDKNFSDVGLLNCARLALYGVSHSRVESCHTHLDVRTIE